MHKGPCEPQQKQEPATLVQRSDLQNPNPKLQYRNPVFLNTTIGIVHANPWELYTPKLNTLPSLHICYTTKPKPKPKPNSTHSHLVASQ